MRDDGVHNEMLIVTEEGENGLLMLLQSTESMAAKIEEKKIKCIDNNTRNKELPS